MAVLFALLVSLPMAEPAPEWRMKRTVAARGEALLQRAMLEAHNRARGALGLPPLAWSAALATAARGQAQEMARSGRFAHAEQPAGAGWQGENLFAGTRGAYDYGEMVDMWLDERRDFVNRAAPGFSRTGRWQDVVHYAQIVWRTTTAIGCAMATGRDDDFLVCRYAPGGDVRGERAY